MRLLVIQEIGLDKYYKEFTHPVDTFSLDHLSALDTMKKCYHYCWWIPHDIDGIVQDCSNSSAFAIELLESCTKPLKHNFLFITSKITIAQCPSEGCWKCTQTFAI